MNNRSLAVRRATIERAKELAVVLREGENALTVPEQCKYFAWVQLVFETADGDEFPFFCDALGFGFLDANNPQERKMLILVLKNYLDVYRNPIPITPKKLN